METKRRNFKNKLLADIKSTELLLNRNYDTIKRLKASSLGLEFVKNRVSKLNDLTAEKEDYLKSLRDDLIKVDTGEKDFEINQIYEVEKIRTDKILKEHSNKKSNDKKEKEEKKEKSKTEMDKTVSDSRAYKQIQKDMNYAHKYFNKVCDQLPDYMVKNLSEMPNNKGYIWRGVHFYGDLEPEDGPTILFEKHQNILVIHEYFENEYKRYEKNGKDRKILVHSEKKEPKQAGFNIMDYRKK